METEVYSYRPELGRNAIYHKIGTIKKIVYDSPLTNKIVFQNGEINLRVYNNHLILSSTKYSSGEITYEVSKQLSPGNSLTALERARKDIIQKVVDLEMEEKERRLSDALRNSLKLIPKQKKSNAPSLEEINFLTNQYLNKNTA